MKQLFKKITKRRLAVFFIMLAIMVSGWWILSPSYLELYVPVASYHRDIWWDTHRTSLAYADEPGVYYVLSRSGTAYSDIQDWGTTEDVVNHFDKWLTERGWVRADIFTEGDPAAPETKFLPFGDQGFVEYVKDGDEWGRDSRVIVSVWQQKRSSDSCEPKKSFQISFTTVKPSFAKSVYHALDD